MRRVIGTTSGMLLVLIFVQTGISQDVTIVTQQANYRPVRTPTRFYAPAGSHVIAIDWTGGPFTFNDGTMQEWTSYGPIDFDESIITTFGFVAVPSSTN